MYIATSVAKPAGISPGSASPKKPNVTIFDFDDVAYMPPRDANGIVVVENIIMKQGKTMHQVYMTRSKTSAPYESDGEEDSINIKQSFEGQHPGNKKEIREFIQNWLGRNVGIIHETCDGQKDMVGTLCAPLQLKPSGQDNNDGLFHMLKFEAFATSALLPAIYQGALTLTATPVTFAADSVAFTGGNTVVATTVVATGVAIQFADVTELAHNDTVTVLGLGGASPNFIEEGVAGDVTVILKESSDWMALNNAFITFRYFKSGTVNYLIELSRG